MSLKYLLLGAAVGLIGTSCATFETQAVWPAPRPLGAEIPAYQPPTKPSHPAVNAGALTEPTGTLRLGQAQALALVQSPELAAFA